MLVFVHLKVEVDEDLGSFLLFILQGFVLFELLRSAEAASERVHALERIFRCRRVWNTERAIPSFAVVRHRVQR